MQRKRNFINWSKRIFLFFFVGIMCFPFVACGEERTYSSADTTNFVSRSATVFNNINDQDVKVDLFFLENNEKKNNPNFGEAVLIKQCIDYKIAHPEEEVYITLTSFHFSVVASACLDRNSEKFGCMKPLYDCEQDDEGFVRLSYLLVEASKYQIHTTVIGQIDAAAVRCDANTYKDDYKFDEYFLGHMNDKCYEDETKTVNDYMNFKKCKWISYDMETPEGVVTGKSASDMMHVKTCTVSNYIDKDGIEHGGSFFVTCINLDGVAYDGKNGNSSAQTGVIVSDHEQIRKVIYNYTQLLAENCEQNDIYAFRNMIVNKNEQQIDLICAGREEEIDENEKIVYLGSQNDSVFEFYFTPLGGSVNAWNTKYSPYAKYIEKLSTDEAKQDYIDFSWNNVKYTNNFELATLIEEKLSKTFIEHGNPNNRLHLSLPGFDFSTLNNLDKRKTKYLYLSSGTWGHLKDFQLSYMENGERQYVTVLNSLNFHEGSASYQANTFFVIKENASTKNNIYVDFAKYTTKGMIKEADRIK